MNEDPRFWWHGTAIVDDTAGIIAYATSDENAALICAALNKNWEGMN